MVMLMNKCKLNNRGFAISSVLYSLLIMVFLVVTLMMGIMASNRRSTHKLVDTIEEELNRYGLSSTELGYKDNGGNLEAQEYVALQSGWYKIELWGAAGGSTNSKIGNKVRNGGRGSYTSGLIYLNKDDKLYFYIGGTTTTNKGGANGGGDGGTETGMGGGGATDVRYGTELETRIMIAAGGGGADSLGKGSSGGSGGILSGNSANVNNTSDGTYTKAVYGKQEGLTSQTQSKANEATIKKLCNAATMTSNTTFDYNACGRLGYGGSASGANGGGGGAGYFGGGAGTGNNSTSGSGAGGSSFIVGYSGIYIKGITVDETYYIPDPTRESPYYFLDGMISGAVNNDEGHAKIELVSLLGADEKPRIRNNDLKEVQYIKDCTKGTNDNRKVASWIELQALTNGTNVALNKQLTILKNNVDITADIQASTLKRVVDGNTSAAVRLDVNKDTNDEVCVIVNLGSVYELDEIYAYHKWGNTRSAAIYGHNLSLSTNNRNWKTIKSYTADSIESPPEQSSAYRYTAWSLNPSEKIAKGIYFIKSALGGEGRFLVAQNNNDSVSGETIAERHVSLGKNLNGNINKWAISELDNGYYKIVEVEGNNALQVKDSLGQENTAVNTAAGHGKDYDWTQWKITPLKDGTYYIQTKVGNNLYLATTNNSFFADSDIRITKKGTGDTIYTTRWKLELASY